MAWTASRNVSPTSACAVVLPLGHVCPIPVCAVAFAASGRVCSAAVCATFGCSRLTAAYAASGRVCPTGAFVASGRNVSVLKQTFLHA